AVASARSRFFSDSPMNLSKSRPGSSLRSGRPQLLATAFAARLLPHPWTPSRRMPRGASTPNFFASGVSASRRVSSQAVRAVAPPAVEARLLGHAVEHPFAREDVLLHLGDDLDVAGPERQVVEHCAGQRPLRLEEGQPPERRGDLVEDVRSGGRTETVLAR